MRKLVLFLIVFGVGLLALVLIDRASRSEPREPQHGASAERASAEGRAASRVGSEDGGLDPAETEEAASPSERLGARPRVKPPRGEEGQSGVHVQLEGPLSFTFFGEQGRKSYTFDSERVEPLGGDVYDAHGLTIEAFDPETGERRVTVLADRGRLGLTGGGGGELGLADDGHVELFGVKVTQHTGGPLVPLVFRAAELVGQVELEAFETPGDVEAIIEGVGLSGRGRGLRFDGRGGEFDLSKGGSVFFSAEGADPLRFSTPTSGPLRITRVDESHLEIRATDGVEFRLQSDPEGQVTAEQAQLWASIEGDDVLLERAVVRENVVATRGTDRFTGDEARLAFAGQNQLRELEIEGEPRWDLTIDSEEEGALRVTGEGEGPLRVDWPGALLFNMQGRSSFQVPSRDLAVEAAGGMRGTVSASNDAGDFNARESVRLTHQGWRVTTEELETSLRADDTMRALGKGPTRLLGVDREGRDLDLTAANGVDLAGEGEDWRVVEARDVELVTTGENGARTTAGLVRDFEWKEVSFEAEREVTYASPLGTGVAERAIVRGEDELDLFGSVGQPARFQVTRPPTESPDLPNWGEFEADEILVRAERVEASGRVSSKLTAGPRTYRLESEGLRLDVDDVEAESSTFTSVATNVTRASLREAGLDVVLSADELTIRGTWSQDEDGAPRDSEATDAVAVGSVELEYVAEFDVGAAGHRFTLTNSGAGRIEAEEGGRVSAWGEFPDTELPYELTADWVEFNEERVRAPQPRIFVNSRLQPVGTPLSSIPSFTQASADWVVADRDGVLLTGDARLGGRDEEGRGVDVQADILRLLADTNAFEEEGWEAAVERFEAWGNFRATYQGNAKVFAEYCLASPERLLLEGDPARIEVLGLALESSQIDIDLENFLLTSERGILRSSLDQGEWSIEFASVSPVQDGDETMIVLLAPVYTAQDAGARADWAVLWVDSDRWRNKGRQKIWDEPDTPVLEPVPPPLPERDLVPNIFRQLHQGELSSLLNALYLEGEAEVTEGGAREARAEAIFVDMLRNQAWLQGAELVPAVELGGRTERLRTRAAEAHTAADGTLRAARASLSACSHEVPHYKIETGELVLEPREGGSWRVSARKNRLLMAGGVQVPIPSIGRAVLDQGGDLVGFESASGELITFDRLVLGRTARFGTAVATAFQRDIGKVGKTVGSAVGFTSNVKGKWDYEAAWLSSRGPLGRAGLLLTEKKQRKNGEEEFWLNAYAAAIPDGGSDRGLIRVPDEERGDFRQWYNVRGRYPISNSEWINLAFNWQSDAAVQSEFFEGEFINYEERDNFLHWRKAKETTYLDAAASVQVEDYRSVIEELPSGGFYRGATPLAHIGGLPLLWEGTLDAAYLRRREGRPANIPQVFGDGIETIFADGLGDREVLRLENTYRLALPVPIGKSGFRATPFLDADFTVWDRGEELSDDPTRLGLFGGAELSASFWKRRSSGFVHEIAPTVSFRSDLAIEESGGAPVVFDARDLPLDGKEAAFGLRQRWWKPNDPRRFDLELFGRTVFDRAGGLADRSEVGLLGGLETDIRSTPFKFLYDVRFDLETSRTSFSRSTIGSQPTEDLAIELSHDRGLDESGARLFEAATIAARYRFSPKWELEARQTISFLNEGNLNNEFSLRRFSHDFLLEIRIGDRAGEGTSFSFNLAPLLAWKRRGLGRLGF